MLCQLVNSNNAGCDPTTTGIFVIIFVYHTHILYYIPYCVLGALIVRAMINLVNVRGA